MISLPPSQRIPQPSRNENGRDSTARFLLNFRGKDLRSIRELWRARYGTDAPLGVKPEFSCTCPGKPQGCERPKCPRKRGQQ